MQTLNTAEKDVGALLRAPKELPTRSAVLKTFTHHGVGHMVSRVMMREGKIEVNLGENLLPLSKLQTIVLALKPVEVHIATGKGGPTLFLNYR